MKTFGRHVISRCFKSNARDSKCKTEHRSQRAAQRMTCEPYVGLRVHDGDVVVQVDSVRVIDRLVDESVFYACFIALPTSTVTIADGTPRPIHSCTAVCGSK